MARTYRLGVTRRVVNALVAALVRRGIGDKSSYLLTTTGRRSGQERTTPVIVLESEGERFLVSPYGAVGWVHNVRASNRVELRRGKTVESATAEELDPDEAGPVLKTYVRSAPVTAPYFDAKAADPVPCFVAEAQRHPVFRLRAAKSGD
ncbi:MAG: nitroreductase family deazaflavin-dependent oxidoreductase [Acidimicrobiales bacterium]|jgi:deazaflavin-dependent oxidoreductase (nitroreductase family)